MRELLMLAKDYNGQDVDGWLCTEKLDGVRAYWNPWSRGMNIRDVPFSNLDKINGPTLATGLWTRYGNIIHCPDWWAEGMLDIPIDCELWSEGQSFQEIVSTVKGHIGDDRWELIDAHVFDSPKWHRLMLAGQIRGPNMERMIKFRSAPANWQDGIGLKILDRPACNRFKPMPYTYLDGKAHVAELFNGLHDSSEGLMLRDPNVMWLPKRTKSLLKVKRFHTGVGAIVGFKDAMPGKIQGLVGSVEVLLENSQTINVSGFNLSEREWGYFEVGQQIEFTYNFLSDDGIPLKPRYKRGTLHSA